MLSNTKILIIQPSLAPYRVDFFNDVANKIPQVHFFFFLRHMISQPVSFDDFNVEFDHSIGTNQSFKNKQTLLVIASIFPSLIRTLIKQRPRVVVTNEFGLVSVLMVVWCRLTGRRHISWTDDSLYNVIDSGWFRKLRREFTLKLSDGLIVCNPRVKEYFQNRYRYRVESVEILQKESVFRRFLRDSLPKANEYIEEYDLKGKKVVLFVGRLVEVKNLFTLLKAFTRIDDGQTRLVLVGSGALEDDLRAMVHELGEAERVIFAGRQCEESLWAWFLIGGLFVLPSISERFGAVVNEALLAGMPVLCSKRAGASCLVEEGTNGFIFDPADVSALSYLIREQLKDVSDLSEIEGVRGSLMEHHYKDALNRFLTVCSI